MSRTRVLSLAVTAILIGQIIYNSVAIAVECNKKPYGPNQKCNKSWDTVLYCRYQTTANCASQQGTSNTLGSEPTFNVGCGAEGTANNHCLDDKKENCLPKYFCKLGTDGIHCDVGDKVQENGVDLYYEEIKAHTESCVPHG